MNKFTLRALVLMLIFGLQGTFSAWADVSMSSTSNAVILNSFGGFGFNTKSYDKWTPEQAISVRKSLIELNRNGYHRMAFHLDHFSTKPGERIWSSPQLQKLYDYLTLLRRLDIKVHLYFHHKNNPSYVGDGNLMTTEGQKVEYAKLVSDVFAHLILVKKFNNIVAWSPANEMSTSDGGWGSFYYGNDKISGEVAQSQYLSLVEKTQAAFQARGLSLRLHAGDMKEYWPLTKANNIGKGVLSNLAVSNHYYPFPKGYSHNGVMLFTPTTENNYHQFEKFTEFENYLQFTNKALSPTRVKVADEFGPLTVKNWSKSVRSDVYVGLNTGPQALHIAERAIGFLRNGYFAIAKWCLEDLDNRPESLWYQHGTLGLTSSNTFSPRLDYYSYGLLTRYIKAGSSIHPVTTSTPKVFGVASYRNQQLVTVAIVSRASGPEKLRLKLNFHGVQLGASKSVCVQRFEATKAPAIQASNPLALPNGLLSEAPQNTIIDTLPPNSLTIYTNSFNPSGSKWCK